MHPSADGLHILSLSHPALSHHVTQQGIFTSLIVQHAARVNTQKHLQRKFHLLAQEVFEPCTSL